MRWLVESGRPVEEARNLFLLLFVLFENFQTLNSRSERHSIFRQGFAANPPLITGVIGAQILHVAAMHIPILRETLGLEAVSPAEWMLMLTLATTVLVAMELDKLRDQHRSC